jgi:histidine phosphotransferase ChpT
MTSRPKSQAQLASFLCSRLCHDLISPVGAIGNGLEILQEEGDDAMREQAIALMNHSVQEAARRLTFFRLAFGVAGGMGEEIRLGDVREAAEGMFTQGRTKLAWQTGLARETTVAKPLARLLLNLTLVVGATLPRGGTINVGLSASGEAPSLSLRAAGSGARLPAGLRTALEGQMGAESLDTHTAVAQLARELAAELGVELAAVEGQDAVELRVGKTAHATAR